MLDRGTVSSMFITFEGPDGSGKSTQLRRIIRVFERLKIPLLTTREPGGTEIGDQVREILMNMKNRSMKARTEILLFNAARAQLVETVLRPALAAGTIVISDRFADSTLAYQGYGHQTPLEPLRQLLAFATGNLVPDLTLLFDLPAEVGLRRRLSNHDEWNRMDDYDLPFHERVRGGYLALTAEAPRRWVTIDASGDADQVTRTVVRVMIDRGVLPADAGRIPVSEIA